MSDMEMYSDYGDPDPAVYRTPSAYLRGNQFRGLTTAERDNMMKAIRQAQIDAVTGRAGVSKPNLLMRSIRPVLVMASFTLLLVAFIAWGTAALTENTDLGTFGIVPFFPGLGCGIARWAVWMSDGNRW